MKEKSPLFSTFLIGLVLTIILLVFSTLLYISAVTSDDTSLALSSVVILVFVLIVDISWLGVLVITTMIGCIIYALKKEVKKGIYIAFTVLYYLCSVVLGYLIIALIISPTFNTLIYIWFLIAVVLAIVFTTLNLKKVIRYNKLN